MSNYSDIKYHISETWKNGWDKNIEDLEDHVGGGGTERHQLANGTIAGFSLNDLSKSRLDHLESIQEGALNNPHPDTHPYTMIDGLANIASTASWYDLVNIPAKVNQVINGTYDALTVNGGIRVTISSTEPDSPVKDKELWLDVKNYLTKVYTGTAWQIVGAAYR